MEDFYENNASYSYSINVFTSLSCYSSVQEVTLHKLQIPPRLNMYLLINKCTTVLIV